MFNISGDGISNFHGLDIQRKQCWRTLCFFFPPSLGGQVVLELISCALCTKANTIFPTSCAQIVQLLAAAKYILKSIPQHPDPGMYKQNCGDWLYVYPGVLTNTNCDQVYTIQMLPGPSEGSFLTMCVLVNPKSIPVQSRWESLGGRRLLSYSPPLSFYHPLLI